MDVRSLDDLGLLDEVEETGDTFAANAMLKARACACASGLITLADDSGLEVAALHGGPGVHSARWAGPDVSSAERNRRLLQRLDAIPGASRVARFVSVVAVYRPDGAWVVALGDLFGSIAAAPRGSNGFGYDPIFLLPDRDCTLAELTPEEKNALSHRSRALAAMLPFLPTLLPSK